MKKIIKIKKEKSQIITPTGAKTDKKGNVSSNNLMLVRKNSKQKENKKELLEKSFDKSRKSRNESNTSK